MNLNLPIYDVSKAEGKQLSNCHDCPHREEIKLPAYISDGREYPEHLCHNNRSRICRGIVDAL